MLLTLLLLVGCDPEAPPPPPEPPSAPDVLLVTIDTLRADRVGAYGDDKAETPNLDRLASEGVLFREAHAVTPLTLPSHASILTGRYPARHGLRDNGGFRLSGDVPTLAERLGAAGYATGAFVSAYVLDGAWGLERGFETYRDPFHPQEVARAGVFGEVELPGAEVVNAAVAWWKQEEKGRKPRFLWVHLFDPHTPWREHPGWEGDPYRGEVAYADGLVGRLLDLADKDDLVIVTSDHGEGLWDHGEREHGVLLGRSVTRVPLLLRPPADVELGPATAVQERAGESVARRPEGLDAALDLGPVPDAPRAKRVVEVPVSSVDIAPTIAGVAGVSLEGADGRSLLPLIAGQGLDRDPVYAETFFPFFHHGWAPLLMAQDGDSRVEHGGRTTRIDWPQDPTGARPAPITLAETGRLGETIAARRGQEVPRPGPVTGDQAAALAALGYITTAAEPDPDAPDPRDRIEILSALHLAEALPADKAIPALERLLAREPGMTDARISLALARLEAGDAQGALEENLAVLQESPEHPTALSNAAWLARELKQPEKALELSARMRAINPQDPRGYRIAAAVHIDREDAASVLEITRQGVQVAPEDPNLHYLLALAEIQQGDPLVGVKHLELARKHGTEAGDLDLWMGVAYEKAGRIDEAKRYYDAATRTMAGDPRPWAMAGWMLYKAGRCDEARPFLVNVAKRGAAGDARVREALQACGAK